MAFLLGLLIWLFRIIKIICYFQQLYYHYLYQGKKYISQKLAHNNLLNGSCLFWIH